MPRSNAPYLFVYGLLRADVPHPMAAFLKNNAKFIGRGEVRGLLYDVGEYPAAVPDAHHQLVGDVYRLMHDVDAILKKLDAFEMVGEAHSAPNEYRREVTSAMVNDSSYEAWIYWYSWPVSHLPRIASGDYLQWIKEKPRLR
jgi:gamma-glutamylcyclotransferase (GGCT)/AIG2-like uncharacterized protein YtfP